MISVDEALAEVFALVRPLGAETVPLRDANNRVLTRSATALRDQPPFSASAMDGYAVNATGAASKAAFSVIGEAAAGHGYAGALKPGEAVRIFTGAPIPQGADRVIIQEDVTREGAEIKINGAHKPGDFIRPQGGDFSAGDQLAAPRRLMPNDIALLASMNIAEVEVARRPKVAILSTGDELVMPGETPRPDQIIASNSFGLHAMMRNLGCDVRLLPIAKDTEQSLHSAFQLCEDADLVLTIGGASVGDHDLIGTVTEDLGMSRSFYKVAMRPGKPLMAGRLKTGAILIGLPGNPVSAMVCGTVFVTPAIYALQGLPAAPVPSLIATLDHDIGENGARAHYMRGAVQAGRASVLTRQDSSLLTVLGKSNALIIRPPFDPAQPKSAMVRYIPL